MVEWSTPTKKSLPPVQRSPWPEVGMKVWVPHPVYAGDRDAGDIIEYRPKQRLVLAVGEKYVIFADGPEEEITRCRRTKPTCRMLCGELSLCITRLLNGIM